jgi:hypothetical protein
VFPGGALSVVVVLIYLVSILFLIDPDIINKIDWVVPILFLVYHISVIMITGDFLQHRERLAMLWLYHPGSTRNEFIISLIRAYISVIIRNFLVITLVFFLFSLTTRIITLPDLFFLFMNGFMINMLVGSLALIFFDTVISPEAKGWTVTNLIFAFILMPVLFKIVPLLSLVSLGIVLFISILIWLAGIRRMKSVDLDFESPSI